MSKKWKMVLTGAAAIAALSAGTTLYAQADKPQSHGGMMQGSGDMKNMMDMMGQMSSMMENCNKMMEGMKPSGGTSKPEAKPVPDTTK
jgi:hypothetical protein